jgi:hypothetical protein
MIALRRAVLLALALAAPLPALPDDVPCASETASFCSDIPPGDRRIVSCLRSRWPELSDSCRSALDRTLNKAKTFISQCELELFSFCADIPASQDAVMSCLGDHAGELSASCKAAYDKARNAPKRLQAKCGPEIGMFCSSLASDDDAGLRVCLAGRAGELSAACRAEVSP